MNTNQTIRFKSPDRRQEWIKTVNEWRDKIIVSENTNEVICLSFDKNVTIDNFEPIHIVLLSCFIEEIKNKGYLVRLDIENKDLNDFIFNEVSITTYWGETKVNHVESPKITDLNLWRIIDEQKDAYSNSIHDYFKRSHFKGYDLSAFKNALTEIYTNVFDHAEANNNAFSYIRYDKKEEKIRVAVCDFGKGISRTLRAKYKEYNSDEIALKNAIKKGVSAQTQDYNKGFGLDDVVSTISVNDELRIVSNNALLYIKGNKDEVETYKIHFDFKGTLIYFDISISSFEKEETFEEFDLW